MPAPGGAPAVRRRSQDLQERSHTPHTQNPGGLSGGKRKAVAQKGAGAADAGVRPPKGKPGGGGGGISKPQRIDRERQRSLLLEPAQEKALQRACDAFNDPTERANACRLQRREQRYHQDLPLSPPAVPCVSPNCRCDMSYHQLKNQLGLGSPSVAKNYKARESEAGQLQAKRREAEKAEKKAEKAAEKAAKQAAKQADQQASSSPMRPCPGFMEAAVDGLQLLLEAAQGGLRFG